jgi:hypothetical protein
MRTWAKATLGGFGLIAVLVLVLAATGAFFVFRSMDRRAAVETEAAKEIDAVKARFGSRPPLVQIVDPRSADIRINRPADASQVPVDTVHVINWKRETGELMRMEFPLWLMRFSTLNIASQLGIAPESFRLTVSDVERYGPGIVADYVSQGQFRVLVWVD